MTYTPNWTDIRYLMALILPYIYINQNSMECKADNRLIMLILKSPHNTDIINYSIASYTAVRTTYKYKLIHAQDVPSFLGKQVHQWASITLELQLPSAVDPATHRPRMIHWKLMCMTELTVTSSVRTNISILATSQCTLISWTTTTRQQPSLHKRIT